MYARAILNSWAVADEVMREIPIPNDPTGSAVWWSWWWRVRKAYQDHWMDREYRDRLNRTSGNTGYVPTDAELNETALVWDSLDREDFDRFVGSAVIDGKGAGHE